MRNALPFDEGFLAGLQEKIARDDQHAFRQVFNHFAGKLTLFAYAIVKNKEAATEIVDEVFVRIWRQRAELPQIQFLKTYLYTATKNSSLNYLSRKAHEQQLEPFDFINIQLQPAEEPDQQLITAEIMARIQSAVEELPPRCKMIFKLVREDGLKYREVAEILHLSVNTVDAQMVIAVRKISEKVRAHFEFFPGKFSLKK